MSTSPTGFANGRSVKLLLLLTLMYLCLQIDRSILAVMLGQIKTEFELTDTQLGFLPLAFSLVFTLAGIPLGILIDRSHRINVISTCLIGFSVMTGLCGLAGNYIHLLLARFGVGAGEAGGGPGAMSLIMDEFPPAQRARAVSLFYISSPVAFLLVFSAGAWSVVHLGWRTTFLFCAAPGILVATALLLATKEPTRRTAVTGSSLSGVGSVFKLVWSRPTLFNMLAGMLLTAMTSATLVHWLISYLTRSHGMSMADVGWIVGVLLGTLILLGVSAGGFIVDLLCRDNLRKRTHLLAASSLACVPLLLVMLLTHNQTLMIVAFGLWCIASSLYYGPGHAIAQSLVGPRQRGTLSSIFYMLSAVISAGLGPQIIGIVSDLATPRWGTDALRYALLLTALFCLVSAWNFLRAGRTIERDMALENQQ